MSDFATSFLSGSVGDVAQLVADIESLAVRKGYTSGTSLAGPITGTTYTLIANLDDVVLAADEVLNVESDLNWSGSTEGDYIEIGIFWNGVEVSSKQIEVPDGAAGTNGLKQTTPLIYQTSGSALTADLELKGRVISGAGGLYYRSRHLKYTINKVTT